MPTFYRNSLKAPPEVKKQGGAFVARAIILNTCIYGPGEDWESTVTVTGKTKAKAIENLLTHIMDQVDECGRRI